jgi:L-alanine-DL-glutamate epimerase-like enolase superfamily enzyme
MKLKTIQLTKLEVPFRTSFKHSSADRSITEAVIAVAQSTDSIIGYGEGCPRSYVTGESIDSAMSFLEENKDKILSINGIESLKEWICENVAVIDKNPAAWCAIETALLDLLGKQEGLSIESLIGIPELEGNFQYTAVLGVATPQAFAAQLTQYFKLGMSDFKIKISGKLEIDKQNIKTITDSLPSAKIRLDANNLWQNVDEATQYISSLGLKFWGVEEPLQVGDYASLKKLTKNLDCKIILDESFLRADQFLNLEDDPSIWVPNIRISKMGGLLRSLAIAERCQELGLEFIIGAQVGETSILTRVALSLANCNRKKLLAQEGAFGTYLLSHDVTKAPIMFGEKGILSLPSGSTYGLGIDYIL